MHKGLVLFKARLKLDSDESRLRYRGPLRDSPHPPCDSPNTSRRLLRLTHGSLVRRKLGRWACFVPEGLVGVRGARTSMILNTSRTSREPPHTHNSFVPLFPMPLCFSKRHRVLSSQTTRGIIPPDTRPVFARARVCTQGPGAPGSGGRWTTTTWFRTFWCSPRVLAAACLSRGWPRGRSSLLPRLAAAYLGPSTRLSASV